MIGVDTDLTAKDDLYDAEMEYVRLHPWIKVSIVAALVSLMGWVLSLVYLTLATGHRDGEEGVHLNFVDRIKTEIVTAVFIAATSELIMLLSHVNNKTWNVSGLLVASGTVSLLIDVLFLIFYLSMVRRMKAEMLWETSVACWLERGIRKVFARQKTTVRVLLLFAGHMAVCFILAVGAFYYRSMTALVLLLLFSAGECYMILRKAVEQYQIRLGVEKIRDGALSGKIDIEQLHGEEKSLAEAINNIGEGLLHAVDDSTKKEWGETPEYKEFEEKTAHKTEKEVKDMSRQLMDIVAAFGGMQSKDPADPEVQAQVKKLQEFITEHYYNCSKVILNQLGQMYGAGGAFTENINAAGGAGAAEFAQKAIEIYCK